MKFTLAWLKDYLDTSASLDEISKTLTDIGLEVEDIIDPASKFDGFVVGLVEACEKHPDADRLNVTTVNTGSEKIQVVCGAPNCKLGLKGIFAPSGSYISGLDVTLKKTKIRGIESNGMLCSEKELELSDEHKGIIELPEDTEIGISAAKAMGIDDPIIDIALTPNRGDCAGIYGIARDLAATGLGTLKTPEIKAINGDFSSETTVSIKDEAKDACPMFIGREIKNIKNTDSPDWLKKRLTAIGLRPISVLVDITNYFTIALGRPLHVYDVAKLQGNIHVRFAKTGEEFDALDDKHYKLQDGMTAICDDSGVLGLGGIVGGVSSSVDENTTNVYLECACFNPVDIATTGRLLQIDSDARYRFERGVDPEFAKDGMELATAMILELCGGDNTAISSTCIAGEVPRLEKTVKYNPEIIKKYSGLDISKEEQQQILSSLGFSVVHDTNEWIVTAPSWRPDIDGRADIVEEILRIYGYDKIQAVELKANDNFIEPLDLHQKRLRKARKVLASRGVSETVTWSFMSSKTVDLLIENASEDNKNLIISNPISSELDMMRPSLLPNLIEGASRNVDRGYPDIGLFEIANSYNNASADGHVMNIACVRTGMKNLRHWTGEDRLTDAFDVKADTLAVLEACNAPSNLQVSTDAPTWYHSGRSGSLRLGKNILAYFGEISPILLQKMGIDVPMMGFEIFPHNIPVPKKQTGSARGSLNASALQPAKRDFAFLVEDNVSADKLIRAVRSADKNLIVAVDIFDIYKGKGVEDGKKSVALYVTLQPQEKTLTDNDFEALTKAVIANVEQQTGGVLRG